MTTSAPPPDQTEPLHWKYFHDLIKLLRPGVLMVIFLTWFAFFNSLGLIPELTSHFRLQYLAIEVIFLALLLIYLTARKGFKSYRVDLVLLAISILANGYLVGELLVPAPKREVSGQHIKMMQFNVNSKNRRFDQVLSCIEKYNPDFISFEEVDDAWGQELSAKLSARYPYRAVRPRPDNFGIAMFSRIPTTDTQLVSFGSANVPSIVGSFKLGEHPVSYICTHVLPPVGQEYFDMRNEAFEKIAQARPQLNKTMILAGDFNCTSWSSFFTKMVRDTGLNDSRQGFGVQPSWPMQTFVFLIPIDHYLVSDDLVVLDRKVLGPVGSDHLPVYIELALAKDQ